VQSQPAETHPGFRLVVPGRRRVRRPRRSAIQVGDHVDGWVGTKGARQLDGVSLVAGLAAPDRMSVESDPEAVGTIYHRGR
jgi:hypothetical protein